MIGPIVMIGTFALTAGSKAFVEAPGSVYYLAAVLVVLTSLVAWSVVQSRAVFAPE